MHRLVHDKGSCKGWKLATTQLSVGEKILKGLWFLLSLPFFLLSVPGLLLLFCFPSKSPAFDWKQRSILKISWPFMRMLEIANALYKKMG